MKKKKLAIILVIIILVVGLVILFFGKKEKEPEIINYGPTGPEQLVAEIDDIEISNILFSNIKVVNQDDFTVVSMKIVNNNDYTINLGDFLVNVYKDDTLVLDLKPHVDKDIRAKNAKEIKVTIKELHSEVNSLEIQLPNLKIIEETDS